MSIHLNASCVVTNMPVGSWLGEGSGSCSYLWDSILSEQSLDLMPKQERATDAEDGFLTPKEVCEMLRVGRSALYEWIARRELPHYKLGRLIRIKKSDLDELLIRQRVERYEWRRTGGGYWSSPS